MAYRRDSRVRATTSAPGTGTATLTDASGAWASFTSLTDGDTFHYIIADQSGTKWEAGLGTKGTSGPNATLTRSAGNVLNGSSGAGTLVDFSSGTQDVFISPIAEIEGTLGPDPMMAFPCLRRLTTETGVPVSTSDRTSQSTLYCTPANTGNTLSLYTANGFWAVYNLPEFGLALSGLTSGKNYDVFAFTSSATPSSTDTGTDTLTFGSATGWQTGAVVWVSVTGGGLSRGTYYFYRAATSTTGTLHSTLAGAIANTGKVDLTSSITATLTAASLELSSAWTSDTSRTPATDLTTQDGVYVKSGATTRRYLGTIRTTGTTTTEDSDAKRFVWNHYNRVERKLKKSASSASWTATNGTWGAMDSTSNRVELVVGMENAALELQVSALIAVNSTGYAMVGVGEDSTSASSHDRAYRVGGTGMQNGQGGAWAYLRKYAPLGYHYYQALDYGEAPIPTVYSGTSGDVRFYAGCVGSIEG